MLKLGKVYRGQMVDMIISNAKLQRRAAGMVQILADCSEAEAIDALAQADNNIARAVLIAKGKAPDCAEQLLASHDGILRQAIASLDKP